MSREISGRFQGEVEVFEDLVKEILNLLIFFGNFGNGAGIA